MTGKKKPKFLRRDASTHSKLGKGRKKKQKWRKPTGRHNKMRNQMKGRPAIVAVGYRTEKTLRDTILEKKPVYVYNLKDIGKIKNDEIAILGKIGEKKKIEIAKKAKELKVEISNLNINKLLKKTEKKKESKK